MEEFYTNLWMKQLPKLESLRQAQLTVLHHPERVQKKREELLAILNGLVYLVGRPSTLSHLALPLQSRMIAPKPPARLSA